MNFENLINQLPAIILAFGSFLASYALIKKSKKEVKTLDADIASKYQNMLSKEQEVSQKNQEEFFKMKAEIRNLKDTLEILQETVKEYSAGIDLLIHQLESNRITPIWKPRKPENR